MSKQTNKKLNVIIDIDNTIIHALYVSEWNEIKEKQSKLADFIRNHFQYVYMDDDFVVFLRPGYEEFLTFLFSNFNVAVWSAGTRSYVDWIVEHLVLKKPIQREDSIEYVTRPGAKLDFVYCSQHCKISKKTYKNGCQKDLKLIWYDPILGKVGYRETNTIIIDDLKDNVYSQGANSIHIPAFSVDKEDAHKDIVLSNLTKHLSKFIGKTNIRAIHDYRDMTTNPDHQDRGYSVIL